MKEDPRHLAEAFYDAFNRGAIDEALELFSEGCDFHEPIHGAISIDQFSRNLAGMKTAMPDSKMNIEASFVSGNTVVVEGYFGGWHTDTLVGPSVQFPATNKHLDMRFAAVVTAKAGKIVAHRVYFNQLDIVTQLGLLD